MLVYVSDKARFYDNQFKFPDVVFLTSKPEDVEIEEESFMPALTCCCLLVVVKFENLRTYLHASNYLSVLCRQ